MTERKLHPWDELDRQGEKLRPAHVYAAERDWPGYFTAVAGKPARETCLKALDRFEAEGLEKEASPHAVDLGCGEGRDTAELLRRGWRVTAIDGHPEAFERLLSRPDLVGRERLRVIHAAFETCGRELAACDGVRLVNASFALAFCRPEHFEELWSGIERVLVPRGRFAGQFFGERDTWASLADRSHHTREQVMGLLRRFEVEELREEESEGRDAGGQAKHWHVFHVVARRLSE